MFSIYNDSVNGRVLFYKHNGELETKKLLITDNLTFKHLWKQKKQKKMKKQQKMQILLIR